jgi:hypothetical protein
MPIVRRLKRAWPVGVRFLALLCLAHLSGATPALAQRLAWQDESQPFRRQATVMPLEGGMPTVVTAEFLSHGRLGGANQAVTVFARGQQVPSRVLQLGPGDFCRVAFQTRKGETEYQIYYGGQPAHDPPEWTATDGLRLETRRWQDCDLQQLESVRQAYETSDRLGSDFVARVYHRHNPFDVQPAPFLSHYSGTLKVPSTGLYQFFTTSQDCSFLLIDGKPVVSWPGRHGPVGQARFKGDIQLSAGDHRFDYWHAAAGQETCAVAAWQVPGATRPEVIPESAFGSDRTARVPAQSPQHIKDGPLPDFRLAIRGEAPIEDSDQWAVRVAFDGTAPAAERSGACSWEFGDGQTSDQWQPEHVYLLPGEYEVTLSVRQRGRTYESVNRVHITRFIQQEGTKNADTLDDYLPVLDTYDLAALDSRSLLQLVRLRLQREEWARAMETGVHVFTATDAAAEDVRWTIATLLDPVARHQLADSPAAFQLWKAAGHVIQDPRQEAQCALAAADIALNELLQIEDARPFLELADAQLKEGSGVDSATTYRVWGDWHARQGNASAALAAYRQAAARRGLADSVAQQSARRGAFSRSAEAFLREGDLPRAAEQLSQWQQDFPLDKSEGYLSTLLARYWMARDKPRIALAVAGDLLVVAPQSPYADQLVLAQAAAEEMLGRIDRAIAACETLLTDYPGSPLRDHAQERIAALQAAADKQQGGTIEPKTRRPSK